jgi:hypothetical protein
LRTKISIYSQRTWRRGTALKFSVNLAFFLDYADAVQPFYRACAYDTRYDNTEWVSMVTVDDLYMVNYNRLSIVCTHIVTMTTGNLAKEQGCIEPDERIVDKVIFHIHNLM